MISAVCWVPRGVAQPVVLESDEPTEQEIATMDAGKLSVRLSGSCKTLSIPVRAHVERGTGSAQAPAPQQRMHSACHPTSDLR